MRASLIPPPAPAPTEDTVRLDLTVREAQILTALAGGVVDFSADWCPTSDCMENLFTRLHAIIGHTRPEGENFHTLFTTSLDGVHCRP